LYRRLGASSVKIRKLAWVRGLLNYSNSVAEVFGLLNKMKTWITLIICIWKHLVMFEQHTWFTVSCSCVSLSAIVNISSYFTFINKCWLQIELYRLLGPKTLPPGLNVATRPNCCHLVKFVDLEVFTTLVQMSRLVTKKFSTFF